jgi:hypothetical protein
MPAVDSPCSWRSTRRERSRSSARASWRRSPHFGRAAGRDALSAFLGARFVAPIAAAIADVLIAPAAAAPRRPSSGSATP